MKICRSLLILVIALFALSPVFGQFITQGSIIGNGSFQFSSSKSESDYGSGSTFEEDETSAGFSVWGGYFVIPNLGVGVAIDETFSSSEDDSDNGLKGSSFTFGPLVRYYFAKGFYGQGYFGFGGSKSQITSGGTDLPEQKYKTTAWNLGVGYSVRLSDRVLLDPMIRYGASKDKDDDSNYTQTDTGFMISVGFTVILVSK